MAERGPSTPQVSVGAAAIVVAAVFLWVGIGQRKPGLPGAESRKPRRTQARP
ncbi:MAG: hypothetical protein IPO15_25155 [Anaerolineae bacterium]|uniref:hypothetical protein n=1 Tax=Candidatus Amarolinea dominans TaxID=3140696 RepID=UPI003136A7A6|nr:hypothetical protein [Anaerolineae bacterium]